MREGTETIQGNFCAACEQSFSGAIKVCPNDGTVFADVRRIESLLFNRYQILSYLGSGSMGTIYKGKQQPLGRLVAIKMLKMQDEAQVVRFKQEAKLCSLLEHPNIIHVYDFGMTKDERPFMVMDFVDGGDFSELLIREGFQLTECLHIFRQICDGMLHAHAKGVIHRDLKPSNIMLSDLDSSRPSVRIVDFGIAQSGKPHAHEFVGSPYYMSPEQAQGAGVDARSDIYSLGCIMYETLTGVVPFAAETPFNTLRMHAVEKPVALRERCPQRRYSEALEHIVMKTLAKDPSRRFQTMLELGTALGSLPEARNEASKAFVAMPTNGVQHNYKLQTATMALKPVTSNTSNKLNRLKIVLAAAFALTMFGGISAFCVNQFMSSSPSEENRTPTPASNRRESLDAVSTSDLLSLDTGNKKEEFFTGRTAEAQIAKMVKSGVVPEGIHIGDSRLSDNAFQCLRGLNELKHLSITHSEYSDKLLEPLLDMPQLEGCMFNTGKLTDNFVHYLTKLTKLKALDLTGQLNLTEKTLAALPPSLEDLNVKLDVGLSDKFALLARYPNLRNLDLSDTQISDEGLEVLGQLKDLRQLELCGTAITDDGVARLLKLKSLKILELTNTRISRSGLLKLASSPSLQQLVIWESGVLNKKDFQEFRLRCQSLHKEIKLEPEKPALPNHDHAWKINRIHI